MRVRMIAALMVILSVFCFGGTVNAESLEVVELPEVRLVNDDDIYLIALLTVAEAEGEPEEGQRLVIDTVLNRMYSDYFPNTIEEVVYQPGQFASMWNGRSERCTVTDEMIRMVREEVVCRTNKEVMFFCAGGYSRYGTPELQIGNHYFSSYE